MKFFKPAAFALTAALGVAGAVAIADAQTQQPPAAAQPGPGGPGWGPGPGGPGWGPGPQGQGQAPGPGGQGWGPNGGPRGGWGMGPGNMGPGNMGPGNMGPGANNGPGANMPPEAREEGPHGAMGPGWRHPGMSEADRAAFFNARVAAVHAGLALTPDQEKLWPPVEAAARDMAKSMSEAAEKARSASPPADPIEGMKRMAERQIARGEALKKMADAAAPLYATLTPEQKERLPMLSHPGFRGRVGRWMHEHGMRWGHGRDGGHWGGDRD